jgi:hypothetical protein
MFLPDVFPSHPIWTRIYDGNIEESSENDIPLCIETGIVTESKSYSMQAFFKRDMRSLINDPPLHPLSTGCVSIVTWGGSLRAGPIAKERTNGRARIDIDAFAGRVRAKHKRRRTNAPRVHKEVDQCRGRPEYLHLWDTGENIFLNTDSTEKI